MLRAGLVGLGRMGLTHLAILNTHPDVQFVAVCDPSWFQLNALAGRMGFQPFRDFREMLAGCGLDVVIIATPPATHAEIVNEAISRGVHFFVEKPLTLSVRESGQIVQDLERAALVNQVGYVNRFNAVFGAVKDLVSEGLLGDLCFVKSEMYGATVLRDSRSAWRTQSKQGGGCLYEFASHCIDLVVYLVGSPARVTGSVLQSIYSSRAEDAVHATFLYDNGLTGVIHVNWSDAAYRKPANHLELIGTKGKILADKYCLKVFLREPDRQGRFAEGWSIRYITDLATPVRFYLRGNEFTTQLDHFVDCVQQRNGSGVCTCRDGLKTDEVIEMIMNEAREAGRWSWTG